MSVQLSSDEAVNSDLQKTETLNCNPPHPVDIDNVHQLQSQILSTEKSQRMAEFFSLLGDANRLRILSVLALKELCVCDLAGALAMSESAVSHQLRALRALRLVSYRKRGRKVFYSLQDNHVLDLYRSVAEHLDEAN
ncbi:helix-turn-helix transcriptional regulator [Coleofasciculus sp. FACHB-64]|jgi:DNA-binding transcriptional ArsR family regulator|uniref:ArsR/SmtB family transcription factor n=1 Tax=Cyanophyceae TaxID=3028117 RepID=UPI001686EF65|nr:MULTISPECIES: metalloregulator ArsR/SmtB family transcription factor [unclassified Coleofasciculus]MBD1841216.1 helix-turn-helix transcriptional regulator [Coleofasciculus sp. FACHB-501]MBD1891554.1 helix-turn-helix transcriptional regulator [Coleofasciculus sp. FACHB-SPT9]MBD1901901.1 helix-turn-helix transcriptional regulator [Coleofasciculus sp. FACHB-125]MBD2047785.1 helix-turn-helix transcriptional regulator [Coleofasciculus sp. FACHB-64]MBD2538563.1 helix-turn-helix transcriptional re